MARRAAFALMCLGGVLAVAPAARAQAVAASPVEAARAEFERGISLAQSHRWVEALEAFQRSRAVADRPNTTYNLALALHELGRMREAAAALEACLAHADAEPALTRDARDLLAVVRPQIATLFLAVAPDDAVLRVDGAVMPGGGGSRVQELDPGAHRIELRAEAVEPQEFEVRVRGGQRMIRRVDLRVRRATVTVRVPSARATVSLDGEAIGRGTTQWQGAPGTHRLRVDLDGHRPWQQVVTLAPGQAFETVVTLTPTSRPVVESPWLWVGVGAGVAAVVTAVLVATVRLPGEGSGGSTGMLYTVGAP